MWTIQLHFIIQAEENLDKDCCPWQTACKNNMLTAWNDKDPDTRHTAQDCKTEYRTNRATSATSADQKGMLCPALITTDSRSNVQCHQVLQGTEKNVSMLNWVNFMLQKRRQNATHLCQSKGSACTETALSVSTPFTCGTFIYPIVLHTTVTNNCWQTTLAYILTGDEFQQFHCCSS